jgi:Protein of unknown function (DUF2848)
MENLLRLTVVSESGRGAVEVGVRAVWNGGWAGRDQEAVRRHAEELAHMGVAPPTTTPIYFPLGNNLATTSDVIQVLGPETSGEIEYALVFGDDRAIYVTVASDHSDRAAERHGIQLSKQMYPDVLAPEVWPYEEVRPHWEQLVLRCWTTAEGQRKLYQEAALAELLSPEEWFPRLAEEGIQRPGLVFLSGTPATLGGLVFADTYELELEDPVRGRAIRHHYRVEVLGAGRQ